MDFSFTKEQKERRAEFYALCTKLEKEKPKAVHTGEVYYSWKENWDYHIYCAKEYARRGWLALAWPEEYGGTGDMMDRVLFAEARGYRGISGVDLFGVQMLAPTLLACASEEIKHEFLPLIASADVMFEQRSDVLLVPSRAVGENDQGQRVVKVMSGEEVEERPVVVGLDDGLRAEIISGLSEGETVVVEVRVKAAPGMGF